MKSMWVLNTTTVDRTYTDSDLKRLVPLNHYNLDSDFYGGRINYIGETDTDVLLLIENKGGLNVIDTAVQSLENVPNKILREMCKRRKIDIVTRTTKEEMIELLQQRG